MGRLALSTLIIARIEAAVTGVAVLTETEVAAGGTVRPVPAIFVEPAGEEVGPDSSGRGRQECRSQWAVIVRVSHVPDCGPSAALRADAINDALIPALVGWSPANGYGVFSYLGMSEPFYNYHGGYSDFPLIFETNSLIEGARN